MRVIQSAFLAVDGHYDHGLKGPHGKIGHRSLLTIKHVCELEERWQRQSPAILAGHIGSEIGKSQSIVLGNNCPVIIRRHCRTLSGWCGGGRWCPWRARIMANRHFCRGIGRRCNGTSSRACDDSRRHTTGETEKRQSFHANQLITFVSRLPPASASAALAG